MSPVQAAALGVAEKKLREYVAASIAGNREGRAREKLAEFVAAANAGGIEPGHALEFLRDVPEIQTHFGRLKSAIEDARDELVVERDEAPGEAASDLKTAESVFFRARAVTEKAESDLRSAREAFGRARDRFFGLAGQLRNQVGNRNITLELLADPALEQAIAVLFAEEQAMHSRIPGMSSARFRYTSKPDAKLRHRLHEQQRELTAEVLAVLDSSQMTCSLPDGGDLQERIEEERGPDTRYRLDVTDHRTPLSPRGEYGQELSYIQALHWGQGVLEAAKLLNLSTEKVRVFVARVLESIPYRDATIDFRPRGLMANPVPRRDELS